MSNQLKVISHSVNHQDGGEPALGRINSWSLGNPTIQPGVRDPGFTLARFRSDFRFTLVGEGNQADALQFVLRFEGTNRTLRIHLAVSEIGLPARNKRRSAVSKRNSPNS
jgi:hypothetical protein